MPAGRSSNARRLTRRIARGVAVVSLVACADSATSRTDDDSSVGARIYLDGVLPSGEPVQGTVQGDIDFESTRFSCASCHRRSGFGSSEGGIYVPPITASSLQHPRELDRAKLFKRLFKEVQPRRFRARVRTPSMRPAYTADTLSRAIRDGVDPGGRTLDPTMPRYHFADKEMDRLITYLMQRTTTIDPGVDDETVYFATVVSANADAAERDAMLATLERFIVWVNRDTAGDLRNPNFSPNYRTEFIGAYRRWKLDVWKLSRNSETWALELEGYYRKRPVFAVISGLVEGPWRPVQAFCEEERLPCLFPHTPLPVLDGDNAHSFYFNRGLALEGEVIARHLVNESAAGARVLQLRHSGARGAVPALAFEKTLAASGADVEERILLDDDGLWDTIASRNAAAADVVVIWPGSETGRVIDRLRMRPPRAGRVFLPSSALEAIPDDLPAALVEKLYFSYPFELPSAYHPRTFRVRAWMRSRGLPITHERIQLDTFYALTLVQFGMEHIVDDFSREYLLEYVEHEAENALNPGTYPRLSLGPGQRFASKGAYIVRLDQASRRIVPESPWIVP